MRFWKELEGKTVAGRYALGGLLRFTDRSAWFAAKDDQKPWVVFLEDATADDDRLLKNLEAASRVKHANVVCIERTGRVRINDKPLVFAVEEATEENLGEVLRERALTPDETAEITASLVAGLTAIHEQGLFHGQVNPANVLASGDTVKLSSDCLQRTSADNRAESFAQDTGDLGATVFEALTQKKLTSPDDPAIGKLPVPFRSIVHSAVIGRWGLADIAAALKKPALEEIRHPIPNVPTVTKPKFAEDVKPAQRAKPVQPAAQKAAQPAGSAVKAAPVSASGSNTSSGNKLAVRILAIIALLAAIGVIWYFYRTQSATSAVGLQTPAAADSTPPASSTTPERAGRFPAVASAPATAGPHEGEHKVWRVVVYTFTNQSAAEHKVRTIAATHPDLRPEVFSASGHSPWLVTVGGAMDREQAFALRGEVRDEGLPGDSYAQNYSR